MRSATENIQLSAALSNTRQVQNVRIGNDENDALVIYLREMGYLPMLSAEEEHTLAVRASAGDPEAKGRLVEANLRLVIYLARSYTGQELDLLDLIQEGNLGLLHAVERFDAESGHRLSTYVYRWIQ
jgi:DNA-directed RNA polymerase sigma subunit (sigma70/sigma32)